MTESTTPEDAELDESELPVDILNLTVVSLRRFVFVVRAISDNGLWPDVEKHLKSRGCDSIAISKDVIAEVQEMLLQQRASNSRAMRARTSRSGGGRQEESAPLDRRLDRFVVSACGTPPHYPPRPPDDWPEGPWDPPR